MLSGNCDVFCVNSICVLGSIFLLCFVLYLRTISKFKTPGVAYIRRDDFTEDFLRYKYGGLYLEGLNFGILRYFPENLRCRLTYYES